MRLASEFGPCSAKCGAFDEQNEDWPQRVSILDTKKSAQLTHVLMLLRLCGHKPQRDGVASLCTEGPKPINFVT
jgi:hypothetical protein